MMPKCSSCGWEDILYLVNAEPCPVCGETKLFFAHLGRKETHQVLIDVETGEMLSEDVCDYEPPIKDPYDGHWPAPHWSDEPTGHCGHWPWWKD